MKKTLKQFSKEFYTFLLLGLMLGTSATALPVNANHSILETSEDIVLPASDDLEELKNGPLY